MSNDQTLNCYSDDQWWDLQDDHHPHDELLLLQNYDQIASTPLDHDHAASHNAKLFTGATQYPETANVQYQYPISSYTTISVSPENLMKRPTKVLTSPAKPKRRRGRGGTMATTTFLNSTIMNFRELVQQHTGMSSTSTPPSSYYASCDQKGPITLCFSNYSSSSSTSESAPGFIHRNQ